MAASASFRSVGRVALPTDGRDRCCAAPAPAPGRGGVRCAAASSLLSASVAAAMYRSCAAISAAIRSASARMPFVSWVAHSAHKSQSDFPARRPLPGLLGLADDEEEQEEEDDSDDAADWWERQDEAGACASRTTNSSGGGA